MDALADVADEEGLSDWVFVGPDAEKLPLAGTGSGGAEEMQSCLGRYAHSFGLLRMCFGRRPTAIFMWFYIHAVDPADSGNFSAKDRWRAMMTEPKMDHVISCLAPSAVKVQVTHPEQLTAEYLISKLPEG